MNYTRENPALSKVNVRLYDFSHTDYESAKTIIFSQNTLFGMKTTEQQRIDMLGKFSQIDDTQVSVIADYEGIPSGVMMIKFWKTLPHWHISMNVNLKTPDLNFNRHRALTVTMFGFCMEEAASRNANVGYVTYTDSSLPNHSVRKRQEYDMVPLNVVDNWSWHDIERIPPYSESKYEVIRQLCGIASGKNKHALAVRQVVRLPIDNRVVY